jgi:ABC-2 type transport system ATP-binding protein
MTFRFMKDKKVRYIKIMTKVIILLTSFLFTRFSLVLLIPIPYNLKYIFHKGDDFMILEIKNIRKSFSGTEVLHGVSFSITSGKALGFLGRNGAGKTTTIRILMGLFDANEGEILLDGKTFNPTEHSIGYLPEERGLYPKQKILDQLIYFGELRGLSRKEAKENTLYWLEKLGVLEYKDKKLETLSKGNQQKVQIAETLLCNPDIIVLDEPFSGLDPVNSQILKDVINELIDEQKLVIFSSHQMTYVEEFCEEIALINKGDIVLTGNLKSIKKEYGANRITLSAVNLNIDELQNVLFNKVKDIEILESKNDYLIIELINGKTKNELLNNLIGLNIDIEKFSVYEPTLTDIFVQKVGDK